MFLNCTNHPIEIWQDKQIQAAKEYGELVELKFPQEIEPMMGPEEIREISERYVEKICAMKPDAVLVAGEFSTTFMVVDALLQRGVNVVCSCSKRETVEEKRPDGTNVKTAVFRFEQFRPYEYFKKS